MPDLPHPVLSSAAALNNRKLYVIGYAALVDDDHKSTFQVFNSVKQHIPVKLLKPSLDLRKNSANSAIARHLKKNPACHTPVIERAFRVHI